MVVHVHTYMYDEYLRKISCLLAISTERSLYWRSHLSQTTTLKIQHPIFWLHGQKYYVILTQWWCMLGPPPAGQSKPHESLLECRSASSSTLAHTCVCTWQQCHLQKYVYVHVHVQREELLFSPTWSQLELQDVKNSFCKKAVGEGETWDSPLWISSLSPPPPPPPPPPKFQH